MARLIKNNQKNIEPIKYNHKLDHTTDRKDYLLWLT